MGAHAERVRKLNEEREAAKQAAMDKIRASRSKPAKPAQSPDQK
jgi:hypothetical protein